MKKAVVYIHGQGGNAGEAAHYAPLFPDKEVLGFDYRAGTPWEAESEFAAYFTSLSREYEEITLIANSIGAFFSLCAPIGETLKKAYFISPVVDMEALILALLAGAGLTEAELKEKGTVNLPGGETLSWDYLSYVRAHPVKWEVPTAVLYGENDALTDLMTVTAFAEKTASSLTVMKGGEHWFHTGEQMAFLDEWIVSQKSSSCICEK